MPQECYRLTLDQQCFPTHNLSKGLWLCAWVEIRPRLVAQCGSHAYEDLVIPYVCHGVDKHFHGITKCSYS